MLDTCVGLASVSLQLTLVHWRGLASVRLAADARAVGARAPEVGARASSPRNFFFFKEK
jgi:hypothetical protein